MTTFDQNSDLRHLEIIAQRAQVQGIDLTATYDEWLNVTFACCSVGEAGRQAYHTLCAQYPGYDRDVCDRKFTACLRDGRGLVTLGTLMDMARSHGIDVTLPKGRPAKANAKAKANATAPLPSGEGPGVGLLPQAQEALRALAAFRFNVITGFTELRLADEGTATGWQRLDDRRFKTLYTRIRTAGIRITQNDLEAIISSIDFTPDYNPFIDYLDSLPAWDGVTDHISALFDYIEFPTDDERRFCLPYLTKWFICAVALMTDRETDNQLMPVLVGAPHAGKTYFCRHLLPPPLRAYMHTIYPGEIMDKDQLISTAECALIMFDEFKLDRRNSNQMKAIVTSDGSNHRAPYARFRERRRRRSSFIGSCNDERYIAESDGDRRYLSVPVSGTRPLDDDTLPYAGAYAQAYQLVREGRRDAYRTTRQDSERLASHNTPYVELDLCEQLIPLSFRPPRDGEHGIMLTVGEIILHLGWQHHSPQINPNNVGKALRHLGYQPHHSKTGNKYYVMEVTADQRNTQAHDEGEAEFNRLQALKLEAEKAFSRQQEPDCFDVAPTETPF